MKKKPRVNSIMIELYYGYKDIYSLVTAFDKKRRIIPSSVNCAFNSSYFDEEQISQMTKVL